MSTSSAHFRRATVNSRRHRPHSDETRRDSRILSIGGFRIMTGSSRFVFSSSSKTTSFSRVKSSFYFACGIFASTSARRFCIASGVSRGLDCRDVHRALLCRNSVAFDSVDARAVVDVSPQTAKWRIVNGSGQAKVRHRSDVCYRNGARESSRAQNARRSPLVADSISTLSNCCGILACPIHDAQLDPSRLAVHLERG